MLRYIRVGSTDELRRRIYDWFGEFNRDPEPYRWTWAIDGIDLEEESPEQIGFQVVNGSACRPEDRDKPAPAKRTRARGPKKQDI